MADYAIHDTTLTGISNVIRKKDGTSALIDPADYADRINLMGMLEEKTVSSSPIVTFSDGADAVPLKSLVAEIAPNLEGVDKVKVTQAGRNLMNQTFEIGSVSESTPIGSTYAQLKLASTKRGRIEDLVPIPKEGRYTFSCASPYKLFLCYFDENQLYLGTYRGWSAGQTFYVDFSNTAKYVGIAFKIDEATDITSADFEAVHLQIEYSATAYDYEPYQTPTTYTASLGRTIYGGEVDVVKGEGVDENGNDFTFEPVEINTRLGNNTMWSEQGDTEVTYRGQGTVTVYPNAEEASF